MENNEINIINAISYLELLPLESDIQEKIIAKLVDTDK